MKSCLCALLLLPSLAFAVSEQEFNALKQRVTQLEKRLGIQSPKDTPAAAQSNLTEERIQGQRTASRNRMRQDGATYDREALREIESLYQIANKEWKSDNARRSLAKLIAKYDIANRTGCAILYMGQMHQGDKREKYYKMAVEYHSNCYYGNGASVGGLARFYLGHHYKEQGNAAEADRLFNELRTEYPDALSHRGKFLVDLLEQ